MKRFLLVLAVLLLLVFGAYWLFLKPMLNIATGYSAKYACSYHFIGGMSKVNIKNAFNFFPTQYISYDINKDKGSVSASIFGLATRKASLYKDGEACSCVLAGGEAKGIKANLEEVELIETEWPKGDAVSHGSQLLISKISRMRNVMDTSLAATNQLFAVTVSNNDFVFDRYNRNNRQEDRLLGWSMTKSICSALYGIMQKEGKVNVQAKVPIAEWQKDERKEITYHDLLQMNSGLIWEEDYSKISDVTNMLYFDEDMYQELIDNPLGEKKWYYSSGTTNMLSGLMKNLVSDYESYPYKKLFDRINMRSAIIEADATGTYVMSSYCWATARDWARFGLLYLNRGDWFGDQIFEPEWTDYSGTVVESSNGEYGAQVWLNKGNVKYKDLPEDILIFSGFGGQRVIVFPSDNIVMTAHSGKNPTTDFNALFGALYKIWKK